MNCRVKGNTKLFGVIGNPISHSISPEIHNTFFNELEMNSIYIPLDIKSEKLESACSFFRESCVGINVTIPHKQAIMKYLDYVDQQAAFYGAVNTVKVLDGKLFGYNTDGFGFSKSLDMNGIKIDKKDILLLGSGGAARVAAFEILRKGGKLTIASRNKEKSEKLIRDLKTAFGEITIGIEDIKEIAKDYFGIVNATPVGMSPNIEEIPIEEGVLEKVVFVFDMIYNPYKTRFIKAAQSHGAVAINGYSMLFFQAMKAQEIWGDLIIPEEKYKAIYEEIENYLKGMYDI